MLKASLLPNIDTALDANMILAHRKVYHLDELQTTIEVEKTVIKSRPQIA